MVRCEYVLFLLHNKAEDEEKGVRTFFYLGSRMTKVGDSFSDHVSRLFLFHSFV